MAEFTGFVEEQLGAALGDPGRVRSRRMFGGWGIYIDDVMCALIGDDALYLKVDEQSVPHFKERELEQFMYPKDGKLVGMSYYRAPEDVFDDPDEMRHWAVLALEAALRSR